MKKENGRELYQTGRKQGRERVAKYVRQTGALLLAGILLLSGCHSVPAAEALHADGSGTVVKSGKTESRQKQTVSHTAEGTMEVQFLDVGQGDATLIQCGEEAMLIDAGNNDKADDVTGYLKSRGITRLSYVVGTHPDADHIGGLDVVIQQFACESVMMPELSHDTKTYRDVLSAMEAKGLSNTPPVVGTEYTLGEAVFTILAPDGRDYGDNTNDYSIAMLVQHGENRFLFTGDAEEAAEEAMLQSGSSLAADVYKVAHHGSRSATTEAFLEAVHPGAAVISCGEGNRYGHPHAEVLNRLRGAGIEVRRTDEEGTVVAVSDGTRITWNVSADESFISGEQQVSDAETAEAETAETSEPSEPAEAGQSYVLNTNTKKFHLPSCASASDIKEENRKEQSGTRDALIAEGYAPCKRCQP